MKELYNKYNYLRFNILRVDFNYRQVIFEISIPKNIL